MEVSEALKRFRKTFNLSQKDVAAVWGAKPQTYQIYEYGEVSPSVEVIKRIAIAYNVTTDYLLGLSDEPRPKPADAQLVSAIINCRDSIQQVLNEVDRLKGQ